MSASVLRVSKPYRVLTLHLLSLLSYCQVHRLYVLNLVSQAPSQNVDTGRDVQIIEYRLQKGIIKRKGFVKGAKWFNRGITVFNHTLGRILVIISFKLTE